MLNYRGFPAEIRLQILPLVLVLDVKKEIPGILMALGTLPQEEQGYYAEAKELHREMNYVVNVDNHEAFRKIKMKDLMKIRCLKLIQLPGAFEKVGFTNAGASIASSKCIVNLSANKCRLRNNFETLIFECSIPDTDAYWVNVIECVSGASLAGLRKVIAILAPVINDPVAISRGDIGTPRDRAKTIASANEVMGVSGKREMLGKNEVWTWKRDDGDLLECGLAVRTGDLISVGEDSKPWVTSYSMSRALAMAGVRKPHF